MAIKPPDIISDNNNENNAYKQTIFVLLELVPKRTTVATWSFLEYHDEFTSRVTKRLSTFLYGTLWPPNQFLISTLLLSLCPFVLSLTMEQTPIRT